jgi:rare lipoprotein A
MTVLMSGVAWPDGDDGHAASIKALQQSDLDSAVMAPVTKISLPTVSPTETGVVNEIDTNLGKSETVRASATVRSEPLPPVDTAPMGAALLRAMRSGLAGARHDAELAVTHVRQKTLPKFFAEYRSLLKQVAMMGLPRIREDAALASAMIVGTASSYNPFHEGYREGGLETASGELYDPKAWTAAIQIGLRDQCGGVRYGRNYLPAYALVESDGKQLIVKINDVGPLKPGRVIDLNERAMRYFDPTLERGLLSDATITLLPGEDWTPGPVGGVQFASFGGTL